MPEVASGQPAYLIVNADDFGYFRPVSQGIIHAHLHGVVTATAVLANARDFSRDVLLLRDCPKLDVGVHLNLTTGRPLLDSFREKLQATTGHFPGKLQLLKRMLTGSITLSDIEAEWRLQVQACFEAGLRPRFVNSHEHLHMLPALFAIAVRIAREFRIGHVRVSKPDHVTLWPPQAIVRDIPLWMCSSLRRRPCPGIPITFLGMSVSGNLSLAYIRNIVSKLRPGQVHELMCHPGFDGGATMGDRALRRYHNWSGELAALTDPSLPDLLGNRVRVISYRELEGLGAS